MTTQVALGPAEVNLTGVTENDAWSLAITLTVGADPYDLTGLTCTAAMKLSSGHVPITATITDAPAGKLTLSQSDAPLIGSGGKWALRVGARTMLSGKVSGTADVLAL